MQQNSMFEQSQDGFRPFQRYIGQDEVRKRAANSIGGFRQLPQPVTPPPPVFTSPLPTPTIPQAPIFGGRNGGINPGGMYNNPPPAQPAVPAPPQFQVPIGGGFMGGQNIPQQPVPVAQPMSNTAPPPPPIFSQPLTQPQSYRQGVGAAQRVPVMQPRPTNLSLANQRF